MSFADYLTFHVSHHSRHSGVKSYLNPPATEKSGLGTNPVNIGIPGCWELGELRVLGTGIFKYFPISRRSWSPRITSTKISNMVNQVTTTINNVGQVARSNAMTSTLAFAEILRITHART